jgi:hypothetical protein
MGARLQELLGKRDIHEALLRALTLRIRNLSASTGEIAEATRATIAGRRPEA